MLSREYGWTYAQILDLPDEVFHLSIEKLFNILAKQIGMGATGYDFSTEEQKRARKFFGEAEKVSAEQFKNTDIAVD